MMAPATIAMAGAFVSGAAVAVATSMFFHHRRHRDVDDSDDSDDDDNGRRNDFGLRDAPDSAEIKFLSSVT